MKPDRALIYTLRSYQQEALDRFQSPEIQKKNSFHMVAPPGAGKTVMGIAMMLASGKRTLILSPNAAIQMQWCSKFYQATDVLNFTGTTTSCDTKADPLPTYLSLTYQALSVKERETGELHSNALTLIDAIAESGVELIICDECHHLTGHWADVVQLLKENLNNPFIIGFTATPPIESDNSGMELYLSLFGQPDADIPLAKLVKEGNLAPFQDLLWLTTPSDEESADFQQAQKRLQHILKEVESNSELPIKLTAWLHTSLEECRFKGKKGRYAKVLQTYVDRIIAFARFLNQKRVEIPIEVPYMDEMETPPNAEDYALILGDYIKHCLKEECREIQSDIVAAMNGIGYRFTGNSFTPTNSGVVRSLTLSRSKIYAAGEILKNEMDTMDESLRLLVLTDYEFGQKQRDGITSIDVIDYFTTDTKCDEIDPIMLTGRSVLVDDDLLPMFLSGAEQFREKEKLTFSLNHFEEKGYMRIEGEGKDWNTRTYIRLITDLFDRGITRCLISTRSLLGEGWDSISCNTLIDLTAIAGYISVNQMRGRTLRKNPNDTYKCANNWDVVTVMPGVHFGMYDFQRLRRKFGHFYGMSDDGVIEKGLGHLHPLLSDGNASEILSHSSKINKNMIAKAGKRMQAFTLWEEHKGAGTREVESLELKCDDKEKIRRTASVKKSLEWMRVEYQKEHSSFVNTVVTATAIGTIALFMGAALPIVLPAISAIALWKGSALSRKRKSLTAPSNMQEQSLNSELRLFATVVFETAKALELFPQELEQDAIEVHSRSDGCHRIVLAGAEQKQSNLFAEAVWELLGPVQNHRYIIERRAYVKEPEALTSSELLNEEKLETEVVAYHPLPSLFGKKKSEALLFEQQWHTHIGLGKLFYTRSEEGREIVKECFRKRPVKLTREKKQIWE